MSSNKPQPAPPPVEKKVKVPTFGGNGVLPGVDLNSNAALEDLIESERDSERRKRVGVRTPPRRS